MKSEFRVQESFPASVITGFSRLAFGPVGVTAVLLLLAGCGDRSANPEVNRDAQRFDPTPSASAESDGPTAAGVARVAGVAGDSCEWPRYRGPDMNGISPCTGWSTDWPDAGPKQLWKSNVGIGFSSMSVTGGKLFTMGNRDDEDHVYCLDAETGETVWHYSYPSPLSPNLYEGGPNATPTVDSDRVFTLGRHGKLISFDIENGSVVWEVDLNDNPGVKIPDWGLTGSPLVLGNYLIVNAGDAGVALERDSGTVAWSTGNGESGYASPIPYRNGPEQNVLIFGAKALFSLNPANGNVVWEHPWKTNYGVNAADPVVFADETRVFISSGYNQGCAVLEIEGDSVREVWRSRDMRNQINCSVLMNGHFFGSDGNTGNRTTALKCIEAETGAEKWSERGFGAASVIGSDGKIIVLSVTGELIVAAASPESFEPIARAQVLTGKCWTDPAMADGFLYCRNARGDIVALDLN